MRSNLWDDATVEHLKQMVRKQMSASKIAQALGCSRNAVIGKMARIGLTSTYIDPRSSRRIKKPIKRMSAPERKIMPRQPAKSAPVFMTDNAKAGDVARCSIFELSECRCKWPVGDPQKPGFGFCGLDKSPDCGSPYCPEHTVRSYA